MIIILKAKYTKNIDQKIIILIIANKDKFFKWKIPNCN